MLCCLFLCTGYEDHETSNIASLFIIDQKHNIITIDLLRHERTYRITTIIFLKEIEMKYLRSTKLVEVRINFEKQQTVFKKQELPFFSYDNYNYVNSVRHFVCFEDVPNKVRNISKS